MSPLLLVLLLGPARADDRDEEVFGPAEEDEEEEQSEEEQREADIFGGEEEPVEQTPLGEPVLTDRQIASRLDEAEKRVTLGGRLYLRGDLRLPEPGDVEGEGETDGYGAEEIGLSSSNLLDLFVDARPNDRLRAYARGRLRYDPTVVEGQVDPLTGVEAAQLGVLLDQLWLNFDAGRTVFLTVGKQRVKWGAGRFWNPTDFLQPERLDALAYFDERTGVGMVKVHLPVDRVNVYAVADWEGAQTLDQVGGAGRVELLVGLTELAASVAARKDRPLRLGGQISTGVWLFDLRVEAAVQHGVTEPFFVEGATWEGWLAEALAGNIDTEDPWALFTESREDDWIPQVVAGAEVGFNLNEEDVLYLGGEYFFNDAGYASADVYPLLLFSGQYQPFYLGRHYAGLYMMLPGPGLGRPWNDMSWTLSAIANLSDQSGVLRFDYSVAVHNELTLNAYVSGYGGDTGEFHYRFELEPVAGVLDEGLDLDAPLVDVGLGLTLGF